MFDVHCHILPMVDDGSSSIEESLDMIKLAYEDGIRGIIATPHQNHPIDFKPKYTVEKSYKIIKDKINSIYPDFELVLGHELYVTNDFINMLKNEAKNFVINNTNYILVEFDRDVTLEFISETVHELLVAGLKPILAHVEMYEILAKSPKFVYMLRNQGAYIQLTGSSIVGKRGKQLKNFCIELLKKGAVDFIVTDAHGTKRRRPVLSESYSMVVDLIGKEKTNEIYIQNPQMLILGEDIVLENINHINNTNRHKRTKTAILAGVMAASLIIIGIGAGRSYKTVMEEPIIPKNSVEYSESVSSGNVETSDKSEMEVKKEDRSVNDNSEKKSQIKSGSDIESKYYSKLKSLEGGYVGSLEGIVANMKYAKENITDEVQRSSTLEAYKQQIFDLEAQCDNQVYAILYDMQNELEENEMDISKVQQYRDEYNSTKMSKQTEYMNKLGY